MSRIQLMVLSLMVVVLGIAVPACSGQPTQTPDVAEQAPPPASAAASAPAPAPEPAPLPRTSAHTASAPPSRPQRMAQSIPEERQRTAVPAPQPPPEPTTVTVTIPQGTALSVGLSQALTSETAQPGDPVSAQLRNPIIVGDRVIFPAGSRIDGKVTDVKSAKKGFKDTGGALAVSFNRIVAPDGHSAAIDAAFSRVAEGSGKKKGAIIGGSAVGGALLGKLLGKDAKGAAIVGGAIGTAVAGSTKGKEAVINPEDQIDLSLQRATSTVLQR